jgi:hypothetical protein
MGKDHASVGGKPTRESREANTAFDWQHNLSDDELERIMEVREEYNLLSDHSTQLYQPAVENTQDRSLRI